MRLLKGYFQSALMSATAQIGDNSLFAVTYLMRLLRVLLLLQIWRVVMHGRAEVSGYTLMHLLTYTLLSEAFRDMMECRTWLESSFWDGSIATRLLRPIGVFGQFAAEWSGTIAFNLCLFSIPLLLCAPLMGVSALPTTPIAGLLALLSLGLAVMVGLGIEYVFAGIAIGVQVHPYVINQMRAALGALLSGAFIPLAILPFGLGKIFALLPFAGQASAPLSIYTGSTEIGFLLGLQLFWAVLLLGFAHWLWEKNREKMVAYGG